MQIPRIPIWEVGVDELATWVEDFAHCNDWPEAEKYANSCRMKKIDGEKMIDMDIKQLKMQLQISKLGHCLEFQRAVKWLCSFRNECADVMELYSSSYSDSEKSVLSTWYIDDLPRSDQEPQRRSGRKVRGSIRRHGREGNKKVQSDVECEIYSKPSPRSCYSGTVTPNWTKRELKLAPDGGDKTHSNRTFSDFEGEAASNEIVQHEKAALKEPGSDNLQQNKINISKVDRSEKTAPCWDDLKSMNKVRKSWTVVIMPEVSADSNDKAGYQFEENKNEGRGKYRLLHE